MTPWNGPTWWFITSGVLVGILLYEVIAIIKWLARR